jgi:hypothetical protein
MIVSHYEGPEVKPRHNVPKLVRRILATRKRHDAVVLAVALLSFGAKRHQLTGPLAPINNAQLMLDLNAHAARSLGVEADGVGSLSDEAFRARFHFFTPPNGPTRVERSKYSSHGSGQCVPSRS